MVNLVTKSSLPQTITNIQYDFTVPTFLAYLNPTSNLPFNLFIQTIQENNVSYLVNTNELVGQVFLGPIQITLNWNGESKSQGQLILSPFLKNNNTLDSFTNAVSVINIPGKYLTVIKNTTSDQLYVKINIPSGITLSGAAQGYTSSTFGGLNASNIPGSYILGVNGTVCNVSATYGKNYAA